MTAVYLTGFCKPHSPPYRCHTSLKNGQHNHCGMVIHGSVYRRRSRMAGSEQRAMLATTTHTVACHWPVRRSQDQTLQHSGCCKPWCSWWAPLLLLLLLLLFSFSCFFFFFSFFFFFFCVDVNSTGAEIRLCVVLLNPEPSAGVSGILREEQIRM